MKNILTTLATVLAAATLIACSGGPSASEMERLIETESLAEAAGFMEVDNLKIENSYKENGRYTARVSYDLIASADQSKHEAEAKEAGFLGIAAMMVIGMMEQAVGGRYEKGDVIGNTTENHTFKEGSNGWVFIK